MREGWVLGGVNFSIACRILAVLVLLLFPGMVGAGTITVANLNDSGPGSLRQAIADAVLGDEIQFADGVTGSIALTTGELLIEKGLTITGPGAEALTISGEHNSRLFNISTPGGDVTITGLKIANGHPSGNGGACRLWPTLLLL